MPRPRCDPLRLDVSTAMVRCSGDPFRANVLVYFVGLQVFVFDARLPGRLRIAAVYES